MKDPSTWTKENLLGIMTVFNEEAIETLNFFYEEWKKASNIRIVLKRKYCVEEEDRIFQVKRINELARFLCNLEETSDQWAL